MPIDKELSDAVWRRYAWLRDEGHLQYTHKARRCEDFFAGMQWRPEDLRALNEVKRPALTINKIISTMSNVLGEQIYNRTDVAFRPRNEGATSEVADALTKVFMQIRDNNQLNWVRSDVFCDGIVTSRGFFDARLDFTDSLQGEVRITQLNPKNVLIDDDADAYDPDSWNDVLVVSLMTIDQIELAYSKKDADLLRSTAGTRTDIDIPESDKDRFGGDVRHNYYQSTENETQTNRCVRVVERQWRKLDRMQHFVDVRTGDATPVPSEWSDERVAQHLAANPDLSLIKKLAQRIRWTVVAEDVVLHDDWSPYQHFTVVPFFPYFQRGRTIGLVENLLGPQELLNKVSSQELHTVNTTANSGWKIKAGALKNMSISELEQRGAQTGLVIELDDINSAEKIQPNQTPNGLDRISFKAEDHIKTISGVSDYAQGFSREDVSAKSVVANQQSGQANLAKVMDNMNRSDFILARNVLDIVQSYYTETRLIHITTDPLTNKTEKMSVNEVTPEGVITNDLTLGKYAVVITNQPQRDTFEDSQFQQALDLRLKAGIAIPDRFVIMSSRLRDKSEIVSAMESSQTSPEAQQQREMQARASMAEITSKEAEAASKNADAALKTARAQNEAASADGEDSAAQVEMTKIENEYAFKRDQMERDFALKREQSDREFALKREEMAQRLAMEREKNAEDARIKAESARQADLTRRAQAIHANATASGAASPTSPSSGASTNPKKEQ